MIRQRAERVETAEKSANTARAQAEEAVQRAAVLAKEAMMSADLEAEFEQANAEHHWHRIMDVCIIFVDTRGNRLSPDGTLQLVLVL